MMGKVLFWLARDIRSTGGGVALAQGEEGLWLL